MVRRRDRLGPALWAVLGILLCSACGDGDEKGSEPAPSFVGESASLAVKANEKAELNVGAVKLKVPEGALEGDTTLTVQVVSKKDVPASKDVAIDVYDFGPDGLMFKTDVELEFDVATVTVPKDKRVDVAVLDEKSNTWQVLPPTAEAEPGKLKTKIKHFSLYTVIFSDAGMNALPPGAAQCAAGFTPCGGELVGTWSFKSGCISAPPEALGASFPSETFASCTEKPSALVGIGVSGTITFDAEGRYSLDQTVVLNPSVRIASSCLEQVSAAQGMPLTCEDLQGTSTGDACVRTLTPSTTPNTEIGTYGTGADATITMTEDGEGQAKPYGTHYCVEGNTLTVRIQRPSEQRTDVYVAEKM